jgi:hypothetical protein
MHLRTRVGLQRWGGLVMHGQRFRALTSSCFVPDMPHGIHYVDAAVCVLEGAVGCMLP